VLNGEKELRKVISKGYGFLSFWKFVLKFPFLIQIRVHNLIHMKKFPKSKGEYIFFLFLISGSGIEELRIQETWN